MNPPSKSLPPLVIFIFLIIVGGLIALSFVWMNGKKDEVARTFRLPAGNSFENADPIGMTPKIQTELQGAHFISLYAPVVKRNGTVDLTQTSKPEPWIIYEFFAPSPNTTPSAYHLPETQNHGTKIRVQAFEKGRTISLSRVSASFSLKFRLNNKGLVAFFSPDTTLSSEQTFAPLPTCPLKNLWNQLPNQSALLEDERAEVIFNAKGYEFRLPRINQTYFFDATCSKRASLNNP